MRSTSAEALLNLNGECDTVNDELTAMISLSRCCGTVERISERAFNAIKVPEDRITISIMIKTGLWFLIVISPIQFAVGVVGLGIAGDDDNFPRWAHGLVELSNIFDPVMVSAVVAITFSDLTAHKR